MRLLLDTHIWLWSVLDPSRLSPAAIMRVLPSIETAHNDPADRLPAATAAALDLRLVTADERLLGGKGYQVLANR